jgi:hypothetical protein
MADTDAMRQNQSGERGQSMTLGEAFGMGLIACHTLPDGVMLRLNPRDGVVWIVPSAEESRKNEMPRIYNRPVPTTGWRHSPLCDCDFCTDPWAERTR